MYVFAAIKAERVSSDKDYVFPAGDDDLTSYTGGRVDLMAPSSLLQDIGKCIHTYIYCYLTYWCRSLMVENFSKVVLTFQ